MLNLHYNETNDELPGHQLSMRSFSVVQATFALTLLKECGHMKPRPPLNVV